MWNKSAGTLAKILLAVVLSAALPAEARADFKAEQMRYPRVKAAFARKTKTLEALFKKAKAVYPPDEIFLRVFKRGDGRDGRGELELWARGGDAKRFVLVKNYPVCAASGALGPKRRAGDGQVPEGFYKVSGFNPASSYHLSMRLNYPNEADRRAGGRGDLGGDIFIHGDCVTIGCIPMTDDVIEELYVAAVEARNRGGGVVVHIFPRRMDDAGMKALEKAAGGDRALLDFWKNLREGYASFEKNGIPPRMKVDNKGKYLLSD